MGQTTNEIENYIETQRDDLGSNIHALKEKLKSVTDWRQQYEARPFTVLGLAFGGGILLATALAARSNRGRSAGAYQAGESHVGSAAIGGEHTRTAHKTLETWEKIKEALIGVAATRLKDWAEQVVPGFNSHYERAEARYRRGHSPTA